MAQHQLGANTIVEEDSNGDTVIRNTANGNSISLDTLIELIGSNISIDDDLKLFFGSGDDWSIRYDSSGSLAIRDETASEDIATFADGGTALEFTRGLGSDTTPVPGTSHFEALHANKVSNGDGMSVEQYTYSVPANSSRTLDPDQPDRSSTYLISQSNSTRGGVVRTDAGGQAVIAFGTDRLSDTKDQEEFNVFWETDEFVIQNTTDFDRPVNISRIGSD